MTWKDFRGIGMLVVVQADGRIGEIVSINDRGLSDIVYHVRLPLGDGRSELRAYVMEELEPYRSEPEARPSPENMVTYRECWAALTVYDVTLHLILAVLKFEGIQLPAFALSQINAAREAHEKTLGEESLVPKQQV